MGRPPAIKEGEIETLLEEREKIGLTTGDIANALDVHRNTAHDRLKKLESQGVVDHDELATADVWYLTKDDPVVTADGGSWIRPAILGLFGACGVSMFGFIIAGFFVNIPASIPIGMSLLAAVFALFLFFVYDSYLPERAEMWLERRTWGSRINSGANAVRHRVGPKSRPNAEVSHE